MEKVKVFNLQKWHAMFSIFLGFFYKSPSTGYIPVCEIPIVGWLIPQHVSFFFLLISFEIPMKYHLSTPMRDARDARCQKPLWSTIVGQTQLS